MICAESISVSLSGRTILAGVSFEAKAGEHVALVGPNGAGKSTLLRVMAGVQSVIDGAVQIDGELLSDLPLQQRAQKLSYLPQQRKLFWDMRAEDAVALGRYAWGAGRYRDLGDIDKAAVDRALDRAGAAAFIGRSVRALSGGEQARVHLARALATEAGALLLDEPCAALDIRHQLELMNVLQAERASGRTIITALHDLELAERYCSRIVVMGGGKIVGEGLGPGVLTNVFGLVRRPKGGFTAV